MGNNLPKEERLYKLKDIEHVFGPTKKSVSSFPIKAFFVPNPVNFSRILVTVGKKNFKHAVKRNLLKRRIKEAYRTNKVSFELAQPVDIAFIYISKKEMSFKEIEKAILNVFKEIKKNEI